MNSEGSKKMQDFKELINEVPDNKKSISYLLFEELIFMEKALKKMKEQVNKDGPIELFKQGKQEFYREHPALKGYNTTIQRYNQTIKQIADFLPVSNSEVKDELLDFLREK